MTVETQERPAPRNVVLRTKSDELRATPGWRFLDGQKLDRAILTANDGVLSVYFQPNVATLLQCEPSEYTEPGTPEESQVWFVTFKED